MKRWWVVASCVAVVASSGLAFAEPGVQAATTAPSVVQPERAWPTVATPADTAPLTNELVDQRSATTRTYVTAMPGQYQTSYYGSPVNFVGPDGKWMPIDASLAAATDGYTNHNTSPTPVTVASRSSDSTLGSVDLGHGNSVSFSMAAAASAGGSTDRQTVTYRDVQPSTDLSLTALADGLKETIYLKSATAPTSFDFNLDTHGLRAQVDDGGNVEFTRDYSSAQPPTQLGSKAAPSVRTVVVGAIPHGWMEDANLEPHTQQGRQSTGVTYSLSSLSNGGYQLHVSLDSSWLKDPKRVYPVRVDPTISTMSADLDDTYATPYVTTDQSGYDAFKSGYGGLFLNRAFLKWSSLTSGSTSLVGKNIYYADLQLYETSSGSCTAQQTDVYAVTAPWSGSAVRWTAQPSIASLPFTTASGNFGATGCSGGPIPANWLYVYNMRDTVDGWTTNPISNNGVSLRAHDESTVAGFKKFASANGSSQTLPTLRVIWSDPNSNAPAIPIARTPTGTVSNDTAQLSATYSDPNAVSGKVSFIVYDDANNMPVAAGDGTGVASGQQSTFTPPAGVLQFGHSYHFDSASINNNNQTSQLAPPTAFKVAGVHSPALTSDFGDPVIMLDPSSNTYYGYASNSNLAYNIPVISSPDLVNWSSKSEAFPPSSMGGWTDKALGINTWAPAIHKFGNSYVLYYAHPLNGVAPLPGDPTPAPQHMCIGRATSTTPAGPFTDDSSLALVCDPINQIGNDPSTAGKRFNIDPSVFTDPATGKNFLLWKNAMMNWDGNCGCSPNDQDHRQTLWARELASDGKSFASGSQATSLLNFDAAWAENSWEVAYTGIGGTGSRRANVSIMEQPEMMAQYGTYYIFYSGNFVDTQNYGIGYGTCTAANLSSGSTTPICSRSTTANTGPWLAGYTYDRGPAMNKTDGLHGPGSAAFFNDTVGGIWMAFHGWTALNNSAPDDIGYCTSPPPHSPPQPCDNNYRGLFIERMYFPQPPDQKPKLGGPDGLGFPRCAVKMCGLGYGPGYGSTAGWTISDAGQVGGQLYDPPNGLWRAATWTENGGWNNLGNQTPTQSTIGQGINSSGLLVGDTYNSYNTPNTFIGREWNTGQLNWTMQLLSGCTNPTSCSSRTWAVNDDSTAVGRADYGSLGRFYPSQWQKSSTPQALWNDAFGDATAESHSGNRAGYYYPNCCQRRAFFMSAYTLGSGSRQDIGDLGGGLSEARGVNDKNNVVGSSSINSVSNPPWHAFFYNWQGNTMTDIGALLPPGSGNSYAWAVNNKDQVVGYYTDNLGRTRGFFWSSSAGIRDLGDLGGGNTIATGINSASLITGYSADNNGRQQAFVMGAGN